MPKVQYTGASHIRKISKKDFEGAGVEGQESIEVARHDLENDYALNEGKLPVEVELNQAALDFLTKVEKGSWKVVEEKAAPAKSVAGGGTPPPVA